MPKFKGGIESVIEMMALLDEPSRKKLLANVAAKDPQLARNIEKHLFTFEDLVRVADQEMQMLLRAIPNPTLVLALRKSSDPVKNHVFRNMSPRAAQVIQEELRDQPPQKVSDVEKAQSEILEIAKKLESLGKLLLRKS